ncbi:Major facilitator superfamily domain, general substrate transporter [Niveomyces insectorum RCEF 264]|uniref:Major facilitator superfamily domain, general substrate transporter n=1 Tax=Niveomyces insectorum RCEF 264 TaxID=1081102 RepID=A0A167XT60_9HYPO|nr:Major facilitator superfamily domain, general substrate transporter [Niveomyces insectorum RCEF 264]
MADNKVAENGLQLEAGQPPEKPGAHQEVDLHEYAESEGYVIDTETGAAGSYKRAKDGHTILIPQPSDDPNDPLNWSWTTKHVTLFIIACTAFLPDYGSATGAVTLIAQAEQWDMTQDGVNHSQAGNVFMLGAGGIFAVVLVAYAGRLPVVWYFLALSTATAAWCAGATTFASFMAARILNGFFSTVTQVTGLIFIQDIFFFHERARKINIWASFFIISPYMGPLLTAFMLTAKPWPVPFWVYTAMTASCFVAATLFLRETYYDRRIPASEQPPTGNRVQQVLGISQFRSRHLRNTFGQALWRCLSVVLKPTTFAWVVGINTTLSILLQPVYNFGVLQIGYFYFTPVVAVILGEIAGHWLHDAFAKQYIRTHHGHFEPEVRLRAIFVSIVFMIVGIVLLGQSLQNEWHYMASSVTWGLYVFGIMITTVAVSSYCLDSYPEASGEVSAWVNFSRTIGGFIISYFQVSWATHEGTKKSFGIQGAIMAAAFIIILCLIKWGKAMRVSAGPLNFATT